MRTLSAVVLTLVVVFGVSYFWRDFQESREPLVAISDAESLISQLPNQSNGWGLVKLPTTISPLREVIEVRYEALKQEVRPRYMEVLRRLELKDDEALKKAPEKVREEFRRQFLFELEKDGLSDEIVALYNATKGLVEYSRLRSERLERKNAPTVVASEKGKKKS